MTAIQALTKELQRIQRAQSECLSSSGYVLPHARYRYTMLVEQAKEIKSSIDWLEKIKKNTVKP